MLVRTAGEIRGKSIVWPARVFAEAPKIAEKSRNKIRSAPFWFRCLFSRPLLDSFVFSQRGRRTRRLPHDAHPLP
jgi:hypothetical protein